MTLRPLMLGLFIIAAGSLPARADLLRLKTGGELRGKIVKTGIPQTPGLITVQTLTGALVTVERDAVELVLTRPLALEEYETRLRHLPDTLAAHWELAEWCRSKHLTAQRETHLQRVIEFDPDHEQAHLALGHVWKDGGWVDWDEYMTARGYVKYKGKYVTQQELDLLEKTAAELKREQEWYPKVRLWAGWLTGRDSDRAQQALVALRGIEDDDAAAAVQRFLGEHAAREVRLLAVEVFTRSNGQKSAQALARLALREQEHEVRYLALQGISERHFSAVLPLFVRELRNESNAVVCRAAQGLQRVGDDRAIAPLIEALITSHKYQVRVPGGGTSYTFARDGSMMGSMPVGALPPEIEAGLRTGQFPNGVIVLNPPGSSLPLKTVTVRVEHQNAEVLSALQKLTGQNFGYDERLWRLWWAAKKAEGSGLNPS